MIIDKILKQDTYIVNKYKYGVHIERDAYNSFKSNSKIVWIVGLRWVWKTSYLLKERIKNDKSIYISCDTVELKNENLFSLIDELQKNYSYNTFFLDEIHFNQNWQWSLKNIYDFLDVKIIFSWSNMINLVSSSYDLSRRVIKFELKEFSFKEYILLTKWISLPKYSFEDILKNHIEIAKQNISWYSKKMLEDYFRLGQFWYYYEDIWNVIEYEMKMQNALKKSIYEDLSDFVDIKTNNLSKVEDIIYYIANAWTSDLSTHSISKKILLSPQTVDIYLDFLKNIWLLYIIPYFWKLSDKLRKNKKFYITNTNILWLFESYIWNFRETFFVSQIKRLWFELCFLSNTDFVVKYKNENLYFEVWWKKKTRKEENIFVIKDDIEIWSIKEIPLWLFWLID